MTQTKTTQNGAGMPAAKGSAKKYSAGGYRAIAVIVFVLGVGGLFLGLLSSVVGFIAHGPLYATGEGDVLSGSLIGYLIFFCKTLFGDFIGFVQGIYKGYNIVDAAVILSAVVLAVGVVLSLVLGIISFFTKTRDGARKCAMTSAVFVFLGYAGFFLTNFYFMASSALFSRAWFDIPTAIVAGVLAVILVIVGIARRKGLGLLNFLLFLLTLVGIYAVCNTNSPFKQLYMGISLDGATTETVSLFFLISALALFVLMAFNFVVSTVRLSAKKMYFFDAGRFFLQLVAALLTIWAGNWKMFTDALLPAILMLAAPFAALALTVFAGIMQISNAKKKPAKATSLAEAIMPKAKAEPDPVPAAAGAPADDGVTVHFPQQPAPEPMDATMPRNVTVNVNPPMYGQPFYPYYGQPMQPAPAPAAEPKAEEPMSEFEKRMADLAKGMEPEKTPEQNAYEQSVSYAVPPPYTPPAQEGKPVMQQQSMMGQQPAVAYEGMKSTYDPFLNNLTPQEKNEFGDLFIGNKYGALTYLPAYVIGGDNREFFSKVFIYYGRFRPYASAGMLDKLSAYISQNIH